MPIPNDHPPPLSSDIVPSGSSDPISNPGARRALAPIQEGSYPANLGQRGLREAAQYVVDVVATALMYLKLPLAALLAVVICGLGVIGLTRLLLSAVHGSFASLVYSSTSSVGGIMGSLLNLTHGSEDVLQQLFPFNITSVAAEGVLCALPLSFLALCDAGSSSVGGIPSESDYPTLIDVQGLAFDQLLGQSETGIAISLDIKHAEIAVQDLVAVVRASDLLNKDLIASALDDFVIDARLAGRALQKLSVKIYSSTDNIIAFNDYASGVLKATSTSGTSVTTTTLTRVFQSSASTLASEVTDILVEAAKTVTALDVLENQLVRVRAASIEDHIFTETAIDTVLSELWTKLGGNGQRLRDLERRARVLKNLDEYRRRAVAHVAVTVQTLVSIEEELNQLMRKLRYDEIRGDFGLPLEAHIASIDSGVNRLREERMRIRTVTFAREIVTDLDISTRLSLIRT